MGVGGREESGSLSICKIYNFPQSSAQVASLFWDTMNTNGKQIPSHLPPQSRAQVAGFWFHNGPRQNDSRPANRNGAEGEKVIGGEKAWDYVLENTSTECK